MGIFDILLIGAAGLGAAYFFNIAGLRDFINNIGVTGDPMCIFDPTVPCPDGNCLSGMHKVLNHGDYGDHYVCVHD